MLVHIQRFERDTDGRVHLDARWQITDPAGVAPSVTRTTELASERVVPADDHARIVSDMSLLFGRFSTELADALLELERR